MATLQELKRNAQALLEQEHGTIFGQAPYHCTLLYPSPYRTGMSSLGYQLLYREVNQHPDWVGERAFLPDDPADWRASRSPLFTLESQTSISESHVIGVSLAYELEITGVLECLDMSGIPVWAKDRRAGHPLVVIGGPLTFSNPVPAAPFADVVVMGEAEEAIHELLNAYVEEPDRDAILVRLAARPGFYVPAIHGERLLPVIAANNACLPAVGQIITPNTELANMHLVESERGCHRKCTFCVMRRSTNGGMRLASPEAIIASIPEVAKRVGLVGAAVSDHPKLERIVEAIVESGREIGLSSLRADRLSPELMELLKRGGYRTLTVASDGASERLREMLEKQIHEADLLMAAQYAARYGMRYLKMYMMIGVPGENDDDIEELIAFSREVARIVPVALGIAPFVAKRNTPLDRQGFAGIREVERTMERLQRELRGTVDLRSVSARWSWVEYCLAQGGFDMAHAAHEAWRNGGTFAAWKAAIAKHRKSEVATRSPIAPALVAAQA